MKILHHCTTAPLHKGRFKLHILIFLIFLAFLEFSCVKIIEENNKLTDISESQTYSRDPNQNCNLSVTVCEDCAIQDQSDENEDTETPTILGGVYNNPYSLSNMTAAFNYIYSSSIPMISTTHYYIKIKPEGVHQLNMLDSLDVELYDYPLNRIVIQEGDYWPDAYSGLPQSATPWLYSVIEKDFNVPSGILYEILEPLHIPNDNEVLEDEAFFITGNSACDSISYLSLRSERKEHYRLAPIDPCDMGVLDDCSGGGGGGGGNSSPKPKGQITFKTYIQNANGRLGASAPLKYIRVVGRRFLKIDKTYTDENGNFQFEKRFPKKVTIIVKFKLSNSHGRHSVRTTFTGYGIWRSMFPLKKNIGTYKGNELQNLNYEFQKGSNSIKRKTKLWIAGVILNTVQETRLFLSENSLNDLPNDLRTYLYVSGDQTEVPSFEFLKRSYTSYLNQDRNTFFEILNYGGTSMLAAVTIFNVAAGAGLLAPLALLATLQSVPFKPDIYFHYKTSDINSLTATKISISMGQQLGICYLSELTVTNPAPGANRSLYASSRKYGSANFSYNDYAPWGNNVPAPQYDYYPGVLAVWESFAQHFGHTITDRIYSNGAEPFSLQNKQWVSDASRSSNIKYLEEFDPNIVPPDEMFNWIPVGIINDLMDSNVDPLPILDNVSGFTYQEIQTALYNKPVTVLDFKNSLKSIKPLQASQIDNLFSSYGY